MRTARAKVVNGSIVTRAKLPEGTKLLLVVDEPLLDDRRLRPEAPDEVRGQAERIALVGRQLEAIEHIRQLALAAPAPAGRTQLGQLGRGRVSRRAQILAEPDVLKPPAAAAGARDVAIDVDEQHAADPTLAL